MPRPSGASPLPAIDERRLGVRRRLGVAEGVERRLGRRIDRRADIAARHRIGLAVEDRPALQRADVDLVEGGKPAFGEGRGRAQLAGAERRQRPAGRADDLLDAAKALVERHRAAELHAHDAVAGLGRDAGRILEHALDETIAAGLER